MYSRRSVWNSMSGHRSRAIRTIYSISSSRTIRNWKKFDVEAFRTYLRESVLCSDPGHFQEKSAEELFHIYDGTVRRIVDFHAPTSSVKVRDRRLSPWFDGECRASRRQSRMLERRHRRSISDDDRLTWVKQVRAMHELYKVKGNLYWTACISTNAGNPKKLWRSINSILVRDKSSHGQPTELSAESLSKFFADKVAAVRSSTEGADPPTFTTHEGVLI